MGLKADYQRMKSALQNILDISHDAFAVSQARYGLGKSKCSACNGRGYTGSENHPECPVCNGDGYLDGGLTDE